MKTFRNYFGVVSGMVGEILFGSRFVLVVGAVVIVLVVVCFVQQGLKTGNGIIPNRK